MIESPLPPRIDAVGTGRRLLLGLALAIGLAPVKAPAAELPTIAVMDFELVDEQQELAPARSEYGRLDGLTTLLRNELQARGIYRTVDVAPARPMIDELRARQNLRECNGCELDIGRALKADRVLIGWVQKVSNLILNINIRIEDVSTGRVVLQKSVDIRSNTEDSWRRGVKTMVNDMLDRGQIGR
jgi:hypothetical protein